MNQAPSGDYHFRRGDRVRLKQAGTFDGYEGQVTEDYGGSGFVRLTLQLFGRSVPLEFDPWQVERVEQIA